MEDEAVVMMYCKKDDFMKEIRYCARYLCVANPNRANADGLLRCLGEVLKRPWVYKMFVRPPAFYKSSPF